MANDYANYKRWCQRGLACRVVSVSFVSMDRVLLVVVVVVRCYRCRRCLSSLCRFLCVRLIQRGMANDYAVFQKVVPTRACLYGCVCVFVDSGSGDGRVRFSL